MQVFIFRYPIIRKDILRKTKITWYLLINFRFPFSYYKIQTFFSKRILKAKGNHFFHNSVNWFTKIIKWILISKMYWPINLIKSWNKIENVLKNSWLAKWLEEIELWSVLWKAWKIFSWLEIFSWRITKSEKKISCLQSPKVSSKRVFLKPEINFNS